MGDGTPRQGKQAGDGDVDRKNGKNTESFWRRRAQGKKVE